MLEFGSVDNDIVIGSIFLVATWTAAMLLRLVYLISDDSTWMSVLPWYIRSLLPRLKLFPASFSLPSSLTILVYGHRTLRVLSVIYLALTAILFDRLETPIDTDNFFTITTLSKSYWVCVRLMVAGLVAVIAQVFDSHYPLRLAACALSVSAIVMDLFSEVGLALELQCIGDSACVNEHSATNYFGSESELTILVWRDIIAATIGLVLVGFTFWQCAMWGCLSSEVRMPSYEHREFMAALNKKRERARKKAEELRVEQEGAKQDEDIDSLFF